MPALQNFPLLDQMADGNPNDSYDCVPTSIAASMRYLVGGNFTGSMLKDAVYGHNYVGGTAADAYVPYCAQHGVRLRPVEGDGTALVNAIKTELAQGHPVLATEPSPYVPVGSGWTHVIAFFQWDDPPGTLTCMDPFHAQKITHSEQDWANTFQFRTVWVVEALSGGTQEKVPDGWHDDGTVLHPPQGAPPVVQGFRIWVLQHSWDPGNLPLEPEGHVEQLELSNPSLGGGTRQRFRWTTLEWTPQRGVFEAWTGQELIKLEGLLKEQNTRLQLLNQYRTALKALLA